METFYATNARMPGTIVLAEDESDLRRIYAHCLREAGLVVWEAADGAQALAMVRSQAPQLLLLDIWMPILNGLEVLEQLASIPEAVGLKVVVLSNQADADTRLEGYALGVVDYWTKDISLASFRERIEKILGLTTPAVPGIFG
jgi:CheY-like chemotaxis protein